MWWWALAIAALAGIREKMKYSDVPEGLRGAWNYLYHRRADGLRLFGLFGNTALGLREGRRVLMETIFLGVLMFTSVISLLVVIILVAKSKLVPQGPYCH